MATWTAPQPPDDDVPYVWDDSDVRWRHDGEVWWGNIGHGHEVYRQWWELLRRGPLRDTEARP